jgi:DNA excision repair protein ERCC-1
MMDDFDDSFDDVLASMEMPEDPKKAESQNQNLPGPSTSQQATTSLQKTQENVVAAQTEITEKPKYSNAIQVNPKQRGNPIIKSITNIPWEFNDQIIPDYVVGKIACVLYLSIRYHNLKPDYLNERLKQLGKRYELRVLLVQVDVKESQNALKHLTRVCLLADLTLMLAWTPEEAGKIIETYKLFENRSPDFIMEKAETDNYQKVNMKLNKILQN